MPIAKKEVWTEETLRSRAKDLGYYVAKIMAYRNDFWYLVRPHSSSEPYIAGEEGEDFINLGAMGSIDAVAGVLSYLESQRKK